MFKKYQPAIIILTVLTLIIVGIVHYVQSLMNKPIDLSIQNNKSELLNLEPLDNIVIPKEFEFKGTKIALAWTDDNTGEDLIIQSDKKIYYGFNSAEVYFSITNISKKDQEADISFLLQKDSHIKLKNNHINLINPCKNKLAGIDRINMIRAGETNYYKAALKFPPMSKGEFFIKATGNKGGYGYLDPWYNSNWSYWKKITIASSTVATTTSNFPVLATSTDSDLRTITHGGHVGQDNGYDIVFADSDGETLLNFEREKYASTTGEIVYWIKTDISSTTDKVIYMYYGNSGASDLATTTGVWDDNYVGVWHLPDDETASTTDSTKYDNDGTAYYDASSTPSGQIDGGFSFDGNSDYVDIADNSSLNISDFITISAWIKTSSGGNEIISVKGDNGDWGYYLYHNASNKADMGLVVTEQKNIASDASINDDVWHHIVGTYNGETQIIYLDGVSKSQSVSGAIRTNNSKMSIGAFNQGQSLWVNGALDEVRVSNVARTAQWIETEYNNQVDMNAFMTFGAEVCVPKPVERSGGENVKTIIKGGTRIKGGAKF
ncbi:DUF2341 domain-containing protein [Candidatus Parcubacteria bacterium]|nr:DUF2341 domain-containing protein [Candidatus Parcubacteria bacterium]